jgi:hypothetical protein
MAIVSTPPLVVGQCVEVVESMGVDHKFFFFFALYYYYVSAIVPLRL